MIISIIAQLIKKKKKIIIFVEKSLHQLINKHNIKMYYIININLYMYLYYFWKSRKKRVHTGVGRTTVESIKHKVV